MSDHVELMEVDESPEPLNNSSSLSSSDCIEELVDGEDYYTDRRKRIALIEEVIRKADGVCLAKSWKTKKHKNRTYDHGVNENKLRKYRCSSSIISGKTSLVITKFGDSSRASRRSGSRSGAVTEEEKRNEEPPVAETNPSIQPETSQEASNEEYLSDDNTPDFLGFPPAADTPSEGVTEPLNREQPHLEPARMEITVTEPREEEEEWSMSLEIKQEDLEIQEPVPSIQEFPPGFPRPKKIFKKENGSVLKALENNSFQGHYNSKSNDFMRYIGPLHGPNLFVLQGTDYEVDHSKRQSELRKFLLEMGITCRLVFGQSHSTKYCFIENAACEVQYCRTFTFKLAKQGTDTHVSICYNGEPKHPQNSETQSSINTNEAGSSQNNETEDSVDIKDEIIPSESTQMEAAIENESEHSQTIAQGHSTTEINTDDDFNVEDHLVSYHCVDTDDTFSLEIRLKGHHLQTDHYCRRQVLKKILAVKKFPCSIASAGAKPMKDGTLVDNCYCRRVKCRRLIFKIFKEDSDILLVTCNVIGSIGHNRNYELLPDKHPSGPHRRRKNKTQQNKDTNEKRISGVLLPDFLATNWTQVHIHKKRQEYLLQYMKSVLNLVCDITFVRHDHEKGSFTDYAACKVPYCRMIIFNVLQGEEGCSLSVKVFGKTKHSENEQENVIGSQNVFLNEYPSAVVELWKQKDAVLKMIESSLDPEVSEHYKSVYGEMDNFELRSVLVSQVFLNVDKLTIERILNTEQPSMYGPCMSAYFIMKEKGWLSSSISRNEKFLSFLKEQKILDNFFNEEPLFYEAKQLFNKLAEDIIGLVDYYCHHQSGKLLQVVYLNHNNHVHVDVVIAIFEFVNTSEPSTSGNGSSSENIACKLEPSSPSTAVQTTSTSGKVSLKSPPPPIEKKHYLFSLQNTYLLYYSSPPILACMASHSINYKVLNDKMTRTMYFDIMKLPFVNTSSTNTVSYCAGVVNIKGRVVPLIEVMSAYESKEIYSKAFACYFKSLQSALCYENFPVSEIVVNCSISLLQALCQPVYKEGLVGYLNSLFDFICPSLQNFREGLPDKFIFFRICPVGILRMVARKLDTFTGAHIKLKEIALVTVADMFKCDKIEQLEELFGNFISIVMSRYGDFSEKADSVEGPCIVISNSVYDPSVPSTKNYEDAFDLHDDCYVASSFYYYFRKVFGDTINKVDENDRSRIPNDFYYPPLGDYILKSIMPLVPLFTQLMKPILEFNNVMSDNFNNTVNEIWFKTVSQDIVKDATNLSSHQLIAMLGDHISNVDKSL